MSFTGWIAVPPASGAYMESFLSRGMEKLSLSEGDAQSQGGSTSSSKKLPIRFVVNPGEVDMVTEFASYNSGTKTRSMTTTVVRSKTIHPRHQMRKSGAPSGVKPSSSNESFGGLSANSTNFVFGAEIELHDLDIGGVGTRDTTGGMSHLLQPKSIDVLRMFVLPSNINPQGAGLGDELGIIILATRGQVTNQGSNMVIDPIQEYHTSDANDEGSNHE